MIHHSPARARRIAHRVSGRGACAEIIGPAVRPTVALKARLLGVISAEFVTEEQAACGAPRLQFAVHDWQRLDAERTACGCAGMVSICAHQMPPPPCLAKKMIPWPVGFPSQHSSCEYRHSRVGRPRLSRERHTSVENNNAHCMVGYTTHIVAKPALSREPLTYRAGPVDLHYRTDPPRDVGLLSSPHQGAKTSWRGASSLPLGRAC
jgi:hypothetical protein